MTSSEDPHPAAKRERAVSREIAVVPGDPGIAYVPGRVLVRGEDSRRRIAVDAGFKQLPWTDKRPDDAGDRWVLGEVSDPLAVVELLRAEGFEAQLEHVFFAHGCDPCAAGPHPSVAFGGLDPVPYAANPHGANPHGANPHGANPHGANPHGANRVLTSSAVPATGRQLPDRHLVGPGAFPHITILDTGLAGAPDGAGTPDPDGELPPLLQDAATPLRISGDLDSPDSAIAVAGGPSVPADTWLDPVAGHGTFIAGLIEQLAPGCQLSVKHLIGPLGDAAETDVCDAILAEAALAPLQRPQILSLSFGARVLESAPLLRSAVAQARVAGIVVVASAGNDGSPLPQFPAAFDGVIGVGAIGPGGPPPWTNYGEWVDACAPGVDLVSAFFASFNGPSPMVNTLDPDSFAAWATWSGTSFSTPVVVAALAREMVLGDCSAADAVERVIRAPHLLRIPCLGTVVNI